jgi:iron complex transport system ATP-binding protein
VTHHVSEIIPGIERVVMLKEGRMVADGSKAELLTSERVSELFGVRAHVHHDGDRYWLNTSQ